jgi:chemotaxis receptor (MCP) glutamine deamidase CheD/CheY-like chemotaxis protein
MPNLRVVSIGEMAVSSMPDDVLVAYGLGSCVAVCLHDPLARVGGMLHALLPSADSSTSQRRSKATKFVDQGIELLLKALLELGAKRRNLVASLCGGARMVSAPDVDTMLKIGEQNVQAAEAALQAVNIEVQAQDTGGHAGRTVKLHVATGQVTIKTLKQGEQALRVKRHRIARDIPDLQEAIMAKVMITDDSLFMRNKLARLLAKHNYETIQAGDGVEAVRLYREARPDVVLMDITMPRKNGLEALADILKFDPRARVIMLTALDQKSVAATAILTGAKDFLAKPVRPERLIQALEKALR